MPSGSDILFLSGKKTSFPGLFLFTMLILKTNLHMQTTAGIA